MADLFTVAKTCTPGQMSDGDYDKAIFFLLRDYLRGKENLTQLHSALISQMHHPVKVVVEAQTWEFTTSDHPSGAEGLLTISLTGQRLSFKEVRWSGTVVGGFGPQNIGVYETNSLTYVFGPLMSALHDLRALYRKTIDYKPSDAVSD